MHLGTERKTKQRSCLLCFQGLAQGECAGQLGELAEELCAWNQRLLICVLLKSAGRQMQPATHWMAL